MTTQGTGRFSIKRINSSTTELLGTIDATLVPGHRQILARETGTDDVCLGGKVVQPRDIAFDPGGIESLFEHGLCVLVDLAKQDTLATGVGQPQLEAADTGEEPGYS